MMTVYHAALLLREQGPHPPASGDSIPTSANQEDHVSMGTIAARQARQVIENVERVIAIELHGAVEALGYRTERQGEGTRKAYKMLCEVVPPLRGDRPLSKDIEDLVTFLREGPLRDVVN
jgi:histidine ammonia-lyase